LFVEGDALVPLNLVFRRRLGDLCDDVGDDKGEGDDWYMPMSRLRPLVVELGEIFVTSAASREIILETDV
jgi:hypothetical protein